MFKKNQSLLKAGCSWYCIILSFVNVGWYLVNAKNIFPYFSFGCLSSLTWYPRVAVQYGTRRTIRTEKIDHKYNNTNDVHRQITNYHPMVSSYRSRSSTVTDSSLIPPSSSASSAAKKSSIWVGVRWKGFPHQNHIILKTLKWIANQMVSGSFLCLWWIISFNIYTKSFVEIKPTCRVD